MTNWALYDREIKFRGETRRDDEIFNAQYDFSEYGPDHPGYQQVEVRGQTYGVLLKSGDEGYLKSFHAKRGSDINLGDVMLFGGMHWLVIDMDFTDPVTRVGRIQQCNRQIRWQNPQTKEIVSRWCTATKPYYSNLADGPRIDTSKREYKIQLPYDSETSQVGVDKRFMLDIVGGVPQCYRLTSHDLTTRYYDDIRCGFVIWNVVSDNYVADNDNVELMICNYESGEDPYPSGGGWV